jgi:hypothetical protein
VHLEHDCGLTVFQHACKMGLEGIVSKRLGSAYRSGRSPDWLKFKNPEAPAVKREAEEDWANDGRLRSRRKSTAHHYKISRQHVDDTCAAREAWADGYSAAEFAAAVVAHAPPSG